MPRSRLVTVSHGKESVTWDLWRCAGLAESGGESALLEPCGAGREQIHKHKHMCWGGLGGGLKKVTLNMEPFSD